MLLLLEAIIVTMCTLSDTIKAGTHLLCIQFSYFEFDSLTSIGLTLLVIHFS